MFHKTLAVLVFTGALAASCPADAQLPLAAEPILTKAATAVRRNREDFDRKNQKPLMEAREDLKEVVADLNKQGKVKEAAAIQNLLVNQQLQGEVFKRAGALNLPQNNTQARLVGRWVNPNFGADFIMEANGACIEVLKSTKAVSNKGQVVMAGGDTLEVRLESGHRLILRPAGSDGMAQIVINPNGTQHGEGRVLIRAELAGQ